MTTVLQRLGRGLALTAATGLVATAVTIAVEVALARTRRYADETSGLADSLDPRDPDIVRAKRLRSRWEGRDGGGAS